LRLLESSNMHMHAKQTKRQITRAADRMMICSSLLQESLHQDNCGRQGAILVFREDFTQFINHDKDGLHRWEFTKTDAHVLVVDGALPGAQRTRIGVGATHVLQQGSGNRNLDIASAHGQPNITTVFDLGRKRT
jgi:hypothetical protein